MTCDVDVARDAAGRAVVSATVILSRQPAPHERLGPLATSGLVSLELVARGRGYVPTATRATVTLSGRPKQFATSSPLGRVAVSFGVDESSAGELLTALVERRGGPTIHVESEAPAEQLSSEQVIIRLRRLWSTLRDRSDPKGQIDKATVERSMRHLIDRGAVVFDGFPIRTSSDREVAESIVRRAHGVIIPVLHAGAEDEGRYRLARQPPANVEVRAGITTHARRKQLFVADRDLGDLLARADADPGSYLTILTGAGSVLVELARSRRVEPGGGGARERVVIMQSCGAIAPVVSMVAGEIAPYTGAAPVELGTRSAVAGTSVKGIFHADHPPQPGPVVQADGPPFWPDRVDDTKRWYLPEVTLMSQDRSAADALLTKLRFDMRTRGHDSGGAAGLEAEITLPFTTGVPRDVVPLWESSGRPSLSPVHCDAVTIALGIPFRNTDGKTEVRYHTAQSVVLSEDFGKDGGQATATFRLVDDWARLAYGALSTPDYQSEPASVLTTLTYSGWLRTKGAFAFAQANKTVSVSRSIRASRPTETVNTGQTKNAAKRSQRYDATPATIAVLAKARITTMPRVEVDVAFGNALRAERFESAQFNGAAAEPIIVPCADHPEVYRMVNEEGESKTIGCQDVVRLDGADLRTFESVAVTAAEGYATVLRSLMTPSTFVIVPQRYKIGRYGPDAAERSYTPRIVLTSVLDENSSELRAVLATNLEADVPPIVRTAIGDELRATSPTATVALPWEAGLTQTVSLALPKDGAVQSVSTPTGFALVFTLALPDFLVMKTMLESVGVLGSAVLSSPDGLSVASTLLLKLGDLTGPFAGGPVTIARQGEQVEMTNRIESTVTIDRLRAPGGKEIMVGQTLQPQGVLAVKVEPPDVGEYEVSATTDGGPSTLEEVRIYVEDLTVEIVFVLDGQLNDASVVRISTKFDGRQDSESIELTAKSRQRSCSYLLPLTAYVADPHIEFVCSTVFADGQAIEGPPVKWDIHTQGTIIPVVPQARS